MAHDSQSPTLGAPGTYCIRVQGHLGESWSDRLGGMAITVARQPDGQTVTTLRGRVADQAALLGVVNSLYDLGFCLLSVQRVESQQRGSVQGA